jgi:hypothetical protein
VKADRLRVHEREAIRCTNPRQGLRPIEGGGISQSREVLVYFQERRGLLIFEILRARGMCTVEEEMIAPLQSRLYPRSPRYRLPRFGVHRL